MAMAMGMGTALNPSTKLRFTAQIRVPILIHSLNPNSLALPTRHRSSKMRWKIEAKMGKATKTGKQSAVTDAEKKWSHHGLITESLPNGMFRVGLVNLVNNKFIRVNDEVMLGYVSGKIRTNHIRIVPGDIVEIEISPYDSNKGRIKYRLSRRDMEKLTGSGSREGED